MSTHSYRPQFALSSILCVHRNPKDIVLHINSRFTAYTSRRPFSPVAPALHRSPECLIPEHVSPKADSIVLPAFKLHDRYQPRTRCAQHATRVGHRTSVDGRPPPECGTLCHSVRGPGTTSIHTPPQNHVHATRPSPPIRQNHSCI